MPEDVNEAFHIPNVESVSPGSFIPGWEWVPGTSQPIPRNIPGMDIEFKIPDMLPSFQQMQDQFKNLFKVPKSIYEGWELTTKSQYDVITKATAGIHPVQFVHIAASIDKLKIKMPQILNDLSVPSSFDHFAKAIPFAEKIGLKAAQEFALQATPNLDEDTLVNTGMLMACSLAVKAICVGIGIYIYPTNPIMGMVLIEGSWGFAGLVCGIVYKIYKAND